MAAVMWATPWAERSAPGLDPIAGAVGAVAGAVVGRQAEKAATQQKAWELLVQIGEGGETLAIVQPADQNFDEGERVRVYTRSDGSARVAKL